MGVQVDEAGHPYAQALLLRAERPPDEPVMSVRVDDPALPHPVRLVRDGEQLGRARRDRARRDCVGIVDDEADAHGRSAERLGAEVRRGRILVDDGEPLIIEGQLGDDLT